METERNDAATDGIAGAYDRVRRIAVLIGTITAVVYTVAYSVVYARHMLSFQGGIPQAKVTIATGVGATAGVSLWGMIVMLSVALAPGSWLRQSAKGQQWIKRSGLKSQSIIGLRIMALVVGLVGAAYFILSVTIFIDVLTSPTRQPSPRPYRQISSDAPNSAARSSSLAGRGASLVTRC